METPADGFHGYGVASLTLMSDVERPVHGNNSRWNPDFVTLSPNLACSDAKNYYYYAVDCLHSYDDHHGFHNGAVLGEKLDAYRDDICPYIDCGRILYCLYSEDKKQLTTQIIVIG